MSSEHAAFRFYIKKYFISAYFYRFFLILRKRTELRGGIRESGYDIMYADTWRTPPVLLVAGMVNKHENIKIGQT